MESNRLGNLSPESDSSVFDELRHELGSVRHLVVAAERRVFVLEAIETVRAVRDDLLDSVSVQGLDVLLRQDLEEVLVAHAARGIAVTGLLGAEDREGDAGRV